MRYQLDIAVNKLENNIVMEELVIKLKERIIELEVPNEELLCDDTN